MVAQQFLELFVLVRIQIGEQHGGYSSMVERQFVELSIAVRICLVTLYTYRSMEGPIATDDKIGVRLSLGVLNPLNTRGFFA